jgi:hypothetical protein
MHYVKKAKKRKAAKGPEHPKMNWVVGADVKLT